MLPLEEQLKHQAASNNNEFPIPADDYWKKYESLCSFLTSKIYPNINAGLACLSKSPGIYTDHGKDHFDEVIRYAGKMLENEQNVLAPYELYLLLCAIRIHDAGNIEGRDEHERKAFSILCKSGEPHSTDNLETRLISEIADAHGGVNNDGNKDKISILKKKDSMGLINFRPQLLASILRFADEICEHRARSNDYLIRENKIPEENKLFQYYAHSIKSSIPIPEEGRIELKLILNIEHLTEKFETLEKDDDGNVITKYLIDDVIDRIKKMDVERRYCNRFLLPDLRYEEISVKIEIQSITAIDNIQVPRSIKTWEFSTHESGYPKNEHEWTNRNTVLELNGESLANEIKMNNYE